MIKATLRPKMPPRFSRSPFFDSACLIPPMRDCIRAPVFDVSEIPPVGIRRKPDQVCPAISGSPDSGSGRENGGRCACLLRRSAAQAGVPPVLALRQGWRDSQRFR